MHMEISIEIRAAAVIKVTLNEMMSVACGKIHQGHEQFSDEERNGRKRELSIWLLIHSCILCQLRR